MAGNQFSERGIGKQNKDCMTRGQTGPHRRIHTKGVRRESNMNIAKYHASGGQDERYHPFKRHKAVSTPG